MARRPGRRRARRRRKGPEINVILWGAGLVAAAVAIRAGIGFAAEHREWLVAAAVVVVVAAVLAAVARARLIAARQRRYLLDNQELAKVDLLTGEEFEQLTAALLRRDGFGGVEKLGRSGDRGVDVVAVGPGGRRFAFQCKRYSNTVGAPEVRNFVGALTITFADHTGVLVTSGRLTRQALEEAGRGQLILIAREELASWLRGTLPPPLRP